MTKLALHSVHSPLSNTGLPGWARRKQNQRVCCEVEWIPKGDSLSFTQPYQRDDLYRCRIEHFNLSEKTEIVSTIRWARHAGKMMVRNLPKRCVQTPTEKDRESHTDRQTDRHRSIVMSSRCSRLHDYLALRDKPEHRIQSSGKKGKVAQKSNPERPSAPVGAQKSIDLFSESFKRNMTDDLTKR